MAQVIFEWDPGKARRNRRKHRITFEEAITVFDDPISAMYRDPDHSEYEERFFTVGLSSADRVLIVAHIEEDERIRIISARKATPNERKIYEETN